MIDINLCAGTVVASLRQVGWAQYPWPEDPEDAAALIRLVELRAEEAGLRVVVQREGDLIVADVVQEN